jgi:hypothetical protein
MGITFSLSHRTNDTFPRTLLKEAQLSSLALSPPGQASLATVARHIQHMQHRGEVYLLALLVCTCVTYTLLSHVMEGTTA